MPLGSVSRPWFIYALVDPRYSEPNRKYRYIGWSYNAEWRYECHLCEASEGSCQYRIYHWIRQLLALGLSPGLELLYSGFEPHEHWQDVERFYIKFFREEVGCDLTNMTDGGDGVTLTPEIIEKIVRFHKGRKRSPESKSRMSEAAKKRGLTDEHVVRLNESHRRSDVRLKMRNSAVIRSLSSPRNSFGRYESPLIQ